MSGIDRDKLPGARPEVADQFLPDKLGIDVTDWTPARLVGTMPVKGNLQPYGLLHGGANAVLAETLGSIAAVLNAPEGKLAVGLELSCTHHRAVRTGIVTGVCTPLHVGRTTSTFEIVITDDHDRRTCTARLTCVTISKPPGDTPPA
ncbi:hotdog fold thioesterase [Actinokineospora globicatena]|uniref:Aromatic compound degradation protein PaaI n=1 Tax=Actinokineospora globicatena TaxID=103729 RepID=A0A9W6QQA8_9PSEU|nr:hotdog fold thioesterase [Actinokineospora globicatena]MCP2304603.1 putative domain 1-containing protein [Actinokineospora globicatena]GLW78026.1 aromatic compound degradation protein PaaI [Actinokineospora globicatena]GLW85308.1 aromatic compound degradation protein PaaI [Actinokineospora globicatena]GLW94065.1 aromatic compound degradation protein PaaI [Actinokineospora globicatena]